MRGDPDIRGQDKLAAEGERTNLPAASSCPVFAVIGYGNELRGDDALGPLVANTVERWQQPNVQALAVHQLTPELAALLATVDEVIFVDARPVEYVYNDTPPLVEVWPLGPGVPATSLGHTGDPRALLALTVAIYGHCPTAWLVAIPGSNFNLGTGLSPLACKGVDQALARIKMLIQISSVST